MTRTACSVALLGILLIPVPAAIGVVDTPPPSAAAHGGNDPFAMVDDAKAAFEKGEYNETLRLIGRINALKGKSAEGLDRYELFTLKAESHLKLKQTTNAIDALEEAAKVAKALNDDKGAAEARALTTLIKRSKNLQFTPKVSVGKRERKSIDITDLKAREEAMDALYADEKAIAKPKVVAAEKRKDLPPVAAALKEIVALKDLEIAATGKDVETKETIQLLVDRAHKLMAKGLDDMTRQTERIAERANELVQYTVDRPGGGYETRTKRAGIDRDDADVLKGVIKDCKQVIQACKDLTTGFTEDVEPFEDLEDLAKQTGERAHDVLTENYTRVSG
jgi:hypothetical protein